MVSRIGSRCRSFYRTQTTACYGTQSAARKHVTPLRSVLSALRLAQPARVDLVRDLDALIDRVGRMLETTKRVASLPSRLPSSRRPSAGRKTFARLPQYDRARRRQRERSDS
jgi:hypothetical protein